MKVIPILGVAGLWLGLATPAPAAGDQYFAIIFGAQRPVIKVPRYAHSFAAFVHWMPGGRFESFTISWMPWTEEIRPLWLEPERGRNLTLRETLRWCYENRLEMAAWGPYQIQPDLWRRALWQRCRLETGQVLYQALDGNSPDGRISNCIHALDFLVRCPGEASRINVLPGNWGESGSYWVALTLRPWYLEPCRTHDWLLPILGLNPNALAHYGLDCNPTNPVTAGLQASVHGNLLPNRVRCGP
jgi:hypothetical protein